MDSLTSSSLPSLSTAYTTFWNWFSEHEREFFQVVKAGTNLEEGFFDKLSPALGNIKEGFYFQTGMLDDATVELELSAEGVIENIVFVEELVQAAPALAGWKFTALKTALDIKDVSIKMSGYEFNASNLSFYSTDYPAYPDEIDITVVHQDLTEENKTTIQNGTLIFLDNCLGELAFATTIDRITIIGKEEAQQQLIPIEKLTAFLTWRQKEFIEKYEGLRHNTDNDNYAGLEAELENGNPLVAVINTDLLEWDAKASHPWIMVVVATYDGTDRNGMPDEETYHLLNELEDKIIAALPDAEGYLNIGRQTADGSREIYFACQNFRKPSKVLYHLQISYADVLEMTYEIYKDKYWQTFERFSS